MTMYQCSNCDSEVKKGTRYCSQCGNRLEWPKKKKADKRKKVKRYVKLNVNPLSVDELYEASSVLGVGLIIFGGFGIITGPIVLSQRRYIGRWLQHLMVPKKYPGAKTRIMLEKVKTIRKCCSWSVAGNIVFGIASLGSIMNSTSSAAPAFFIIFHIVGIIIGEVMSAKAQAVIKSLESGEEFLFDRTAK